MSKKDYFQFKSFKIYHKNAPLKVGTDAVLLGAITEAFLKQNTHLTSILDLGCGTGVIGQILLHGIPELQVHFLDPQEACIRLSEANITLNQQEQRSELIHAAFEDYKPEEKIDFIVCNPPFYFNSLSNPDPSKALSKHSEHIDWQLWWSHAYAISAEEAACSFVFPKEHCKVMMELAASAGWRFKAGWNIFPTPEKEAHRMILFFDKNHPGPPVLKDLIIELDRHQYSPDYIDFCQHLYLNF